MWTDVGEMSGYKSYQKFFFMYSSIVKFFTCILFSFEPQSTYFKGQNKHASGFFNHYLKIFKYKTKKVMILSATRKSKLTK